MVPPTSARGLQCEALARRRTVATWIEAMTGVPIPTSSDYSFRSALKDGTLLCRVMNTLSPYAITKVVELNDDNVTEDEQIVANIESFLAAAEKFGLVKECLFTVDDLLKGAWEDRPKVVECLYQLQRQAEQEGCDIDQQQAFGNGGQYGRYDPYAPYPMHSPHANGDVYGAGQMANGVGLGKDGLTPRPTGITKLMEQCTSILRDRMWQDSMAQSKTQQQVQQQVPVMPQAPPPQVQAQQMHMHAQMTQMAQMAQMQAQASGDGAFRTLEEMLKQVLSGITTATERRGRQDMEHMEKYIKSLEAQIEMLQTGPASMYDESGDACLSESEMEGIQESAEALAQQLQEYRKVNDDLQVTLENERKTKENLRTELDHMKHKVDDLDGIQHRYKDIQTENRKLYNMVQDLRGNIRVFCRVRPMGLTGDSSECCVDVGDQDGDLAVNSGGKNDKRKTFKFDKVFGMSSTQEQVYSESQPLIRSVLDGYNVCIFAYGQTGSGKTHTMSGTNVEQYSGRGINYRALDDLFQIKADRAEEVDYNITVQMLEIYNENLRDLLIDDPRKVNKLEIRSTEKSGLNVPDAIEREVECTEDVLDVMEIGSRNRACAGTKMNDRSSRSHSVLTVVVDGYNRVTDLKTHGCLHLVDLAGSERIARSQATGDRLEEAKHINKSLSALGDVMAALASKSAHVPFRNSKLTQLLQDSLSGQAKAMMFVHIAPEQSSRGESLSTAMFGARVSQITLGRAQKNTESGKVFEARDAISKLRLSADQKDAKIKELQKVVETERMAARSVVSEKERMERELKTLRDELNLTRRSLMENGHIRSVSTSCVGMKLRDGETAPPSRRSAVKRYGSSESSQGMGTDRSSVRGARPGMSARTSVRNNNVSARSGVSEAHPPSSRRPTTGRTPLREGSERLSLANRRPATGDRSMRRSTVTKDSQNAQRTSTRPRTTREGSRPVTAGPVNPRRAALTRCNSSSSSSKGGNGGGWR